MRKRGSTFLGAVLGAVVLLGVGSTAHAVSVSPLNFDWTTTTTSNLNSAGIGTVTGFTGLSLLYKSDFGGGEDGSLASSHNTTFSSPGGVDDGPSAFTVSYVSGAFASCPTCILVVKDGNHNPAQYLYNLGNWNGTEQINGSGFWLNGGGAISNVAVWGTGSAVPVPGTSLLFGLGMTLFAGWHRKHARQI
ncbi:MAG TPA: hypothetical protein VGK56_16215 [Anaerolineales bacterium]